MKPLHLMLWVVLLALPLSSVAERRANAGNQALKRMQYLMKQLQQDNQALVSDNKKLTDDVARLKKELHQASRDIDRKKASIARFEHSNQVLNKRIDRLNARNGKIVKKLKNIIGKYRDLVLLVHELKAGARQDTATISQREHQINVLEKKNLALFGLNQDLMQRYHDKGVVDTVEQLEPFSGMKQVEEENLLQQYRFRNEDNQVRSNAATASR